MGQSICLHDFVWDEVDAIPLLAEEFDDWPPFRRNVARQYEATAADAGDFRTFEEALGTHRLIAEMYSQDGAKY